MTESIYIDEKEVSGMYNNVLECILRFANGEKKRISNKESGGDLLAVNVVCYKCADVNFIESVFKNYRNAKSLTEFCQLCGYNSTKTFTRHFKQSFDTTPKQWLLSIKKSEVMYFLKYTSQPLKKIAKKLGFSNISHLNDFCVKRMGMTPNKIRNLE